MIRPSQKYVILSIAVMAIMASEGIPSVKAQVRGESSQPANIVVLVQGRAAVKRRGWTGFAQLTFGANLQSGDLLRLEQSSSLQIVCSDLKMHSLGARMTGNPCTTSHEILKRTDGSLLRPTRNVPKEASCPVVLSPRSTMLLSDHPLLRWTEARGALTYYLTVRSPELIWTGTVRSKTVFTYPETAPRLQVGQQYKLIVALDNECSSENEEASGLGFSLLPSGEHKEVLAEQKQLDLLGLEEGPTRYLIARLFASHGLNAEAIQEVEGIANRFQVAATERLLGELYVRVRLPRQAEAHYLVSLQLSEKEQDAEGQMLCRLALADIYSKVLGNLQAATENLQVAIEIAGKVGDDTTIAEARKQLSGLEK